MSEASTPSNEQKPAGIFKRGQDTYIRSHLDELAQLPEPTITWTTYAINENVIGLNLEHDIKSLQANEIVERVEKIEGERNGHKHRLRWSWHVTNQAHNAIQILLETRGPTLPCPGFPRGHKSGFTTITSGEEYQCKCCGAIHDRETIEEVYG